MMGYYYSAVLQWLELQMLQSECVKYLNNLCTMTDLSIYLSFSTHPNLSIESFHWQTLVISKM